MRHLRLNATPQLLMCLASSGMVAGGGAREADARWRPVQPRVAAAAGGARRRRGGGRGGGGGGVCCDAMLLIRVCDAPGSRV